MIKNIKLTGAVLAIAAASVFVLTPVVASAMGSHKIQCACEGKKACKGKAVMPMSKKMCEKIGGTVQAEPETKK